MKFPCCPRNLKKFYDSVNLWEIFEDTAFNTRFNGLNNYRRAPYRVRLVCSDKVGTVNVVCYKSGLRVNIGMKYTLLKAAVVNIEYLGKLMNNYHVIKAYLCWGKEMLFALLWRFRFLHWCKTVWPSQVICTLWFCSELCCGQYNVQCVLTGAVLFLLSHEDVI